MGRNSIERAAATTGPSSPQADRRASRPQIAKDRAGRSRRPARRRQADGAARRGGRRRSTTTLLRDPAKRDPRGYIIPADQPDFPTATKFVNALIKTGVTVHRATAPFDVAGKSYPAGLLRGEGRAGLPAARPRHVRAAGPSRRLPLSRRAADAALRQRRLDAGLPDGRPVRPDPRRLRRPVREDQRPTAKPPPGTVTAASGQRRPGSSSSHRVNDAFIAVNRLLAAGEEVYWLKRRSPANGKAYPAGHDLHPDQADPSSRSCRKPAEDLGSDLRGRRPQARRRGLAAQARPDRALGPLRRLDALGLDAAGCSSSSSFPSRWSTPPRSTRGTSTPSSTSSSSSDGGIPGFGSGGGMRGGGGGGRRRTPVQYPRGIPSPWSDASRPTRPSRILKAFVENGGTIVAIGSSTEPGLSLRPAHRQPHDRENRR